MATHRDIAARRTLALVGPSASGKTSLAEALLWKAGAVGAPGSVEKGSTVSDHDPLERKALRSLNTTLLHFTLLTLLSATAVAALQTVGAVLVVAMLVTPGATAYLLTDRFSRMIGLATTMGVGTSMIGAYASYFFDGSTGGCIVTLQSALFVVVLVFGRKHGLIASRARQRAGSSLEAVRVGETV